eukprot:SM000107S14055  [mRNA]  locus=s107:252682:258978:+ [translate_table: standard]
MALPRGSAALITGAGSGIGRAIALACAERGVHITAVDLSEAQGLETVRLAEQLWQQRAWQSPSHHPVATFVTCNVASPEELAAAFAQHMHIYGRLDLCVNNAGIGEREWFAMDSSTDGKGSWRTVLNVNLVAVIDGTRLAVCAMKGKAHKGVIINVASAAGLYPSPNGPVYSGSKGGVVLFTRSLAHLRKDGIRVNALCPEYVETPLISQVSGQAAKHFPKVLEDLGGYIPMTDVVDGIVLRLSCAMELVDDESKSGDCLWITNRFGKLYWPPKEEKDRYLVSPSKQQQQDPGTSKHLPQSWSKLIVRVLSTDFRAATCIVRGECKLPLPKGQVLIRNLYAGVNASDINYSAGRYFGSKEEAEKLLPFDAGFEAVGIIVAVGEGVKGPGLTVNSPVATLSYGAFAQYSQVDAKFVIPVAEATPEMVAMLTSGLTASISLEQAGRMGSGEVVLVTAAAGGTGQFAVQLAKLAGNKVVATCGGQEKAALLGRLGVDRVIDYRQEEVSKVLKKEFPQGVDVVYESVGGAMFQTCLNSLARFGRMIIIGMMSQVLQVLPDKDYGKLDDIGMSLFAFNYEIIARSVLDYTAGEGKQWAPATYPGLCEKLLWKSQSVAGFFLVHYTSHWKRHLAKLSALHKAGLLQVSVDPAKFSGLQSVPEAVEYLHSGKSIGKASHMPNCSLLDVVVHIAGASPQQSRL